MALCALPFREWRWMSKVWVGIDWTARGSQRPAPLITEDPVWSWDPLESGCRWSLYTWSSGPAHADLQQDRFGWTSLLENNYIAEKSDNIFWCTPVISSSGVPPVRFPLRVTLTLKHYISHWWHECYSNSWNCRPFNVFTNQSFLYKTAVTLKCCDKTFDCLFYGTITGTLS